MKYSKIEKLFLAILIAVGIGLTTLSITKLAEKAANKIEIFEAIKHQKLP